MSPDQQIVSFSVDAIHYVVGMGALIAAALVLTVWVIADMRG